MTPTELTEILFRERKVCSGGSSRCFRKSEAFQIDLQKRSKGIFLLIAVTIFLFLAGGDQQVLGQIYPAEKTSFMTGAMVFDRPELMMRLWYHNQFDKSNAEWLERYNTLIEPEQIERYQKSQLKFFNSRLDLAKTTNPLNAKITGRLERDGYRVEKIIYESQPRFYVTASLFLPAEKYPSPWPAVVVACGHSNNGKASESYQRICILGAKHGLAMLIVDPVDQGERLQHLGKDGKCYAQNVLAHNLMAIGGIPIGRSTASYMMNDLRRGIDYLQSRSDILPDRIGVLGNSGGGTQSAYLMALDPRILAAAPACYMSRITGKTIKSIGPPDDEQAIFGQVTFGMDHPDYCIMRAPRPTLICTATKDFFAIEDSWETFRYAKRIYGRFGLGDRIDLVEADEFHGYTKGLREAGISWMVRWLAGRDENVLEEESVPVLTDDQIRSADLPGVMSIQNARTVYDLNRDRARELTGQRRIKWQNMTMEQAGDLVRQTAGFRKKADLPLLKIRQEYPNKSKITIESEPGIYIPMRARWTNSDEITIILDDEGRNSDFVGKIFQKEKGDLLAPDLRGWGETQGRGGRHSYPDWFGPDRNEFYLAFFLGKTYVGMRAEDLLNVINYCQNNGKSKFRLLTRGGGETVALHAAVAEPGLISRIVVYDPLPDWNKCVEKAPCPVKLTDYVYGALKEYDKSDLRKLIPSIIQEKTLQ